MPPPTKTPAGKPKPTARHPANTKATDDLAGQFKLLADPTRLAVIALLAKRGEVTVTALCVAMGQSQPAISHHLQILRVAGLIEGRREGKYVWYSVDKATAAGLVKSLGETLGTLEV